MLKQTPRSFVLAASAVFVLLAAGCAIGQPTSRFGMVQEEGTGLMFGSAVETNIFVDSSQFVNRRIKVVLRNTSGDKAVDLGGFREQLNAAYEGKGYDASDGDDFGIKLDINVLQSSQIQQSLAAEYGFIGMAGGGIAGSAVDGSKTAIAAGALSGATLGAVLGSFVVDDTYIIVAEVRIGVLEGKGGQRKRVTFSNSVKIDEDQTDRTFKPFLRQARTRIAVYAGGRNIAQSEIAEQVRQRLIRIMADII